jgi:hypothetical protein
MGGANRFVRSARVCLMRPLHRVTWIALFSCIVPFGFANAQGIQALGGPAGTAASVHGRVLNQATRQPLAGALVYSADQRYATITDDRGQFIFKFPPEEPLPKNFEEMRPEDRMLWFERNYRPNVFEARKPGYLDGSVDVQAWEGNPDQSNVTIYLEPESLIVGRVNMPDPEGDQRIRVELFRQKANTGQRHWVSAGTFETWSNGEFRFFKLRPGSYRLVTRELIDRDPMNFVPGGQLYGFSPVAYPGTSDFSTATSIQLGEGATFQADVSVERHPYYSVRIPVLNAGTNKKMTVHVYPLGNPSPGYSLGYNAGVQLIQGTLPDGDYTVRADTEGEAGTTGILNFSVNGRPVTGPQLVLAPNVSLNVSLREELGPGRSAFFEETPETGERFSSRALRRETRRVDLRVVLEPIQEIGEEPDISGKDGDGTYEHALVLENVRPGKYRVEAETSIGYAAEITAGGKDLLHQPLVIGQDSSNPPIEITLKDDGAEVEGTIEDATNANRNAPQTASGYSFMICFLPLQGGAARLRQAYGNPDGSFVEEQLPPGSYLVVAVDGQCGDLTGMDEDAGRLEPKGQVIELAARQKAHVGLKLIHEGDSE